MRILIDTHVFLWAFLEPRRLSSGVEKLLKDTFENEVYLSNASAWEVTIKYGNKKLALPDLPEVFIKDRTMRAGFMHLPIRLEHVTQVHTLPPIHRDPFDRLLISQARVEGMMILTGDPHFAKYKIDVLNIFDF